MAREIAFAPESVREAQFELLRSAIVCCCAIALIAAGQALPF